MKENDDVMVQYGPIVVSKSFLEFKGEPGMHYYDPDNRNGFDSDEEEAEFRQTLIDYWTGKGIEPKDIPGLVYFFFVKAKDGNAYIVRPNDDQILMVSKSHWDDPEKRENFLAGLTEALRKAPEK